MSYCYLVSTLWNPGQVRAAKNCRQGPHPEEIQSCGNDPVSRQAWTDQRGCPAKGMVLGAAACAQSTDVLWGDGESQSQSKEERGTAKKTTLYKFR